MYAGTEHRSAQLSGLFDELVAARHQMIEDADPATELEPVCVWTNSGQLGDPGCPGGYKRMAVTARDFQSGGVFAPGGGGKYIGALIEKGVDPVGSLGEETAEERQQREDDAETVELGLDYETTAAGFPGGAPLMNYLAIGAVGLALLLSKKGR